MKIGYISTYLPQRCGIATYLNYFLMAFRRVYPDAKITVFAEDGAERITEKNFSVIPCWNREKNYPDQILPLLNNLDILHIQHEYSIYRFDNRLPDLLEKVSSSIKKIITIHCVRPTEFSPRGFVDEEYAARIAKLADKVIVHLPSQSAILKRLGVPENKIFIIPHGTYLTNADKIESRRRLKLPEKGRILTMFGFLKSHKHYEIAIDALLSIIKNMPDVYLFIAGAPSPTAKPKDIEYAVKIEEMIKSLKIQSNVIYPKRFFSNEDVPYIFGASDIVLFPYYEEDRSASGSFHLAMGAGKTVIASRIPKFEELKNISDELLVLPFNAEGIANLAKRIFQDKAFSDYIHNRTNEYAEETSWESISRKTMELYR